MTTYEYPRTMCSGGDPAEPCTTAPTTAVDVSAERGETAWTTCVALCDRHADSAHRGGFYDQKPIAEVPYVKAEEPVLARFAQYLTVVATNGVPEAYSTHTCPECLESMEYGMAGVTNDGHVLSAEGYVLVGCEGYWVINPEALGMEPGNWSDWTVTPDIINN